MKGRLFVIGASGHGVVVAEAGIAMEHWSEVAFLDDKIPVGSLVNGLLVVGNSSDLHQLSSEEDAFVVGIGDNKTRMIIYAEATSARSRIASIVHPSSVVSKSAVIAPGCVVMANSVVNARADIGECSIVNTAATVDHDCILGIGVHVSPGAHLAGGVEVGDLAWIGIGATVNVGVRIGSRAIVGASAAVIRDVGESEKVVGVPAKSILSNKKRESK